METTLLVLNVVASLSGACWAVCWAVSEYFDYRDELDDDDE